MIPVPGQDDAAGTLGDGFRLKHIGVQLIISSVQTFMSGGHSVQLHKWLSCFLDHLSYSVRVNVRRVMNNLQKATYMYV